MTDMHTVPTPLYVRLSDEPNRRLQRAVATSGKTKRQLIEDAVSAHLDGDGLVVGRIALSEPDPEVLTLGEAAAVLRVSEAELEAAAEQGVVPARRIGSSWRFARSALINWLSAPLSGATD